MTPTELSDRILALYQARGGMEYEGEGVSQLGHAAQCGALARAAGATPELQLAAWLHDIGHLLAGLPGTPTMRGIDDRHETRGAAFLAEALGPEVAEPVALHVAAKRYLVAVNLGYYDGLTADSRRSLVLQGGPMSPVEQEWFKRHPCFRDALRLRAWDEAGKLPQPVTDGLIELEHILSGVCVRQNRAPDKPQR